MNENEIKELWKEWCNKRQRLEGQLTGADLREMLFDSWEQAFDDGKDYESEHYYPEDL